MKHLRIVACLLLMSCATSDPDMVVVCEPNGGPCHDSRARVLPISSDEVASLYFAPDRYSRAQGRYGATVAYRWGTLFVPDGRGVFFTQVSAEWDGTVPQTCGAPGKFKVGTTERVQGVLTGDCAAYLSFPMPALSSGAITAIGAAGDGLVMVCVNERFAVMQNCDGAHGTFIARRGSALADVRPGDVLRMPPAEEAHP